METKIEIEVEVTVAVIVVIGKLVAVEDWPPSPRSALKSPRGAAEAEIGGELVDRLVFDEIVDGTALKLAEGTAMAC